MASTSETVPAARRGRLRRSDPSNEGFARVRRGRGFSYLDTRGRRLRDAEAVLRIKELAIPPAWEEVWICADPLGHLQATGVDAASSTSITRAGARHRTARSSTT
jgi:DNA topoisomerase IB